MFPCHEQIRLARKNRQIRNTLAYFGLPRQRFGIFQSDVLGKTTMLTSGLYVKCFSIVNYYRKVCLSLQCTLQKAPKATTARLGENDIKLFYH
jgi:hypothetical protein